MGIFDFEHLFEKVPRCSGLCAVHIGGGATGVVVETEGIKKCRVTSQTY